MTAFVQAGDLRIAFEREGAGPPLLLMHGAEASRQMFAALLPESWMAHALFYGVMLSFLFNGAGHFAMPEAKDKTANIVIVGGTVAAIHAAMKIERLIGQYSNIRLTLIHDQPNVLFYPLLPEVIGGTMQPGGWD